MATWLRSKGFLAHYFVTITCEIIASNLFLRTSRVMQFIQRLLMKQPIKNFQIMLL